MKKKILLFLILFTLIFIPKINAACEDGYYQVKYNPNGGTISLDPTCTSSTLSSIKPKRSGYKFIGWSTNKTATTAEYKSGGYIELTKPITLYAVWVKGYSITYDANGGSISSTKKTVYPTFPYGTLLTPKKKGYKFLGWFTLKSGGEQITNETIVTNKKAHTLYAHYSKIKYKITYELNGGTNNKLNKTNYYVTTKTFYLENPTKTGYRFLGWYKENTYKTKITKISKGTTGNKTFYAKWTPIKYNISFVGNGSTSGTTLAQKNLKYNKTYTLNANKFKKTDYVFNSWNTKADGTGKSYTNSASIKNLTSKEGKTVKLYAIWKRKEYKITYVLDGGINPDDAYTTYTKVSSFTLKEPTKEGYKFLGWYSDSEFKNKVTSITKGSTGNKTFYAKWKFESYTINYVLNGGYNPSDAITSYKYNDVKELPVPTRIGYTFIGWYKESNFINKIERIDNNVIGNLTLYAKWEKEQYKITYVLDGGVNFENAQEYYSVTDEIILGTPTKENNLFIGWYTDSEFTNEITKINNGSTGDITLYTLWDLFETYNITYVLNGGVNPNDAVTEYTKADAITLPIPTKEGYTFDGWYTESNFINKIEKIDKRSTGNKTFYAKWIAINYNITYVLNGGANPNNTKTSYTIETSTYTLPTPTKSGYDFKGWYTESDFVNSVTKITKGSTGDKTFYAKWEKIPSYTITYVLNGGVNPNDAITEYTKADAITLPIPTKEGYTFDGWYKESNFINRVESISEGSTGDKTFYAKWKSISYTITYNLNGGENPGDAITSYTIEIPVTLPTPTRAGYSFQGWHDNSEFNGDKIEKLPVGTIGNKIYYAKWKELAYYIHYELDGGLLSGNYAIGFNVTQEVILPIPTRNNYIFEGWYTESSFQNIITKIPMGTTNDITVYAKWKKAGTYSITYVLNGGVNPNNAPSSYTNNSNLVLPIPTKDGYGFDGWYTESTFINKVESISVGTTGNKTFYAKWGVLETYSISYELNGGENPSDAPTEYNNYEEVNLPTPVRHGYNFMGWYTNSSFTSSVVTTIEKGTTGNKKYYAKWEVNSFERLYDYIFYNNNYDNKFSGIDDIKNTFYNIFNEGKETFTASCDMTYYSDVQDCFDDFSEVFSDANIMKSISDYVNPYNSYNSIKALRSSYGNTESITVNITYNYEEAKRNAIENKLDEIITNNNIGTMSDYDKILTFHDYIIDNTVYDSAAADDPYNEIYKDSFNAYGLLFNNTAVCQGYADMMAIFLDRYKIPNIKVSSNTHTWNLVYLNGSWKHLDATWDDPVSYDGINYKYDTYFLITTSELHEFDKGNAHTYVLENYLEAN